MGVCELLDYHGGLNKYIETLSAWMVPLEEALSLFHLLYPKSPT